MYTNIHRVSGAFYFLSSLQIFVVMMTKLFDSLEWTYLLYVTISLMNLTLGARLFNGKRSFYDYFVLILGVIRVESKLFAWVIDPIFSVVISFTDQYLLRFNFGGKYWLQFHPVTDSFNIGIQIIPIVLIYWLYSSSSKSTTA